MSEHNRVVALDADTPHFARSQWGNGTAIQARPRNLSPLFLVFGIICQQLGLVLAFVAHRLDMRMYLCVHIGICATAAILGVCWIRTSSTAQDANEKAAVVLLLVACTGLAGPLGTLIAAALLVPQSTAVRKGEAPFQKDSTTIRHPELTRLELVHGSLLDCRLRIEGAHGIRPLLDVIIEGTQFEKFDALSLISKHYAPALAPALQRALQDKDGSIRVLAATVMAQLHNGYIERIGALQAAAQTAPECSKHWNELAQAHLDYAGSGLLEPSRVAAEENHARANLALANDKCPVTSHGR